MRKTETAKPTHILLELQYFPPIQYFSKFLLYPNIVIEQHENYSKGSYRNRCHIAGPNGLQRLSIPLLKGKNEQQNIRQVKIAYHQVWQNAHWNGIKTAYGNAPYFDYYADEIKVFYEKNYEFLFDLNWDILQALLVLLSIEANIQLSHNFQKTVPTTYFDGRNSIFPKKHRQKEDKLFNKVAYPQVFEEKHGFIPNLSILDLLFCHGPEAAMYLESTINS